MILELAGEEVAADDLEFFVDGVAGEFDDLEAVAEGGVDGFEPVGGADEEDAGEVEGEFDEMVGERAVLLGVEDFEEGGGGVAGEVHERLAGQVVDVEEHLAYAAHVARGQGDLVDVEELLVDVGVRQPQISSQGRGLPGSGRTGRRPAASRAPGLPGAAAGDGSAPVLR